VQVDIAEQSGVGELETALAGTEANDATNNPKPTMAASPRFID
jgi:hypothetical protein